MHNQSITNVNKKQFNKFKKFNYMEYIQIGKTAEKDVDYFKLYVLLLGIVLQFCNYESLPNLFGPIVNKKVICWTQM